MKDISELAYFLGIQVHRACKMAASQTEVLGFCVLSSWFYLVNCVSIYENEAFYLYSSEDPARATYIT
jgi:hypothetical protein